jgi:hypothetical protein
MTPHPLLVLRSKIQSRVIPVLSLRAFVVCKKGEVYLPVVFVTAHSKNIGCNPSEMNSGWGSGGRSCYEPGYNSAFCGKWDMFV